MILTTKLKDLNGQLGTCSRMIVSFSFAATGGHREASTWRAQVHVPHSTCFDPLAHDSKDTMIKKVEASILLDLERWANFEASLGTCTSEATAPTEELQNDLAVSVVDRSAP